MKTKAIQIDRESTDTKELAKAIAAAVLSFLFGAARIFGSISPFSIALVCGLPIRYAVTATVGGIVSAIVFARTGFAGYYITALLVALGGRMLLARFLHRKVRPIFLSLTAFTATALGTVFFSLIRPMSTVDFVLMISEIVLSSCFTYFFAIGGNAVLRKRSGVFSYTELASLCIIFVAILTTLANFSIFRVNIGVIVGVAAVYVIMSRFGIIGSSVASIAVSIGLCLSSTDMLEFCGILIIASFLAGAFSPLGKFGQMAAFIALSTFCLFLMGAPVFLTYRLIDIFFSTAIFVLIPERWINLIKADDNTHAVTSAVVNPRFMQGSVATKLSFASDTIRDLEDELETVSSRFSEIDYNNISTIYETAANTVCKGCTKMLTCWDNDYSDTLNAFNPLSDTLRISGEVTKETLPSYFRERCCKSDKLCAAVNEYYRGFVSKQNAKRQISESRRIVFEQFNSIADMLVEVSEEIGGVTGYDERLTRAISTAYQKLEAEPEQVVCAIDSYGRSCVEIYTTESVRTSPTVICETISTAAQRDYDLPSISEVHGRTKIALFERASYAIEFSGQQSCVGNNAVCGDSYEFFSDSKGYSYLLISDGMGNGKRAAIDSVMTCSVLTKLIKAGFGLESAIRMINSSLLVKSTDESLATIDLAKIDLYSGKTEFCKAGAATSFLFQKGELKRISSGSLPVGILQGVGFEKQPATLKEGDIIVMVSDGVTSAGEGWIAEELRRSPGKSAKDIAQRLCGEAKDRCQALHPDDVTVLVARLRKGV